MELGSFTAAARDARIGQPALSKTIAAFERSLGVRLLDRATTGLTPTEEGRRLYARCKLILEDYAETIDEVRGQAGRVAGVLRVSGPVGFGELRLNTLVLQFLGAHPEIEVELGLTDRMIDLVEEGVDLAIRFGSDLPPGVIARRVAAAPRLLVGSAAYLNGRPPVRRPQDLSKHNYIGFAGLSQGNRLNFMRNGVTCSVDVTGRYRVNSSLALRQCFCEGAGLGSAPAWLVQDLIDEGRLVRLLPKWSLPEQPVHLIYPSRRYMPRRTRAFLDFMLKHLPLLPGFRTS